MRGVLREPDSFNLSRGDGKQKISYPVRRAQEFRFQKIRCYDDELSRHDGIEKRDSFGSEPHTFQTAYFEDGDAFTEEINRPEIVVACVFTIVSVVRVPSYRSTSPRCRDNTPEPVARPAAAELPAVPACPERAETPRRPIIFGSLTIFVVRAW